MDLKKSLDGLSELIISIENKAIEVPLAAAPDSAVVEQILQDDVIFFHQDLGTLILLGEDAHSYRGCVDAIYKQVAGKTEHISRSAVESSIQTAVLKALNSTIVENGSDFLARLSNALTTLEQELSAKGTRWKAHFPVGGIQIDNLPYSFGKCEFYFADETHVTKTLNEMNTVISSNPNAKAQAYVRDEIRRRLLSRVWVRTDVEAVDANAAKLLAQKRVRLTVDILNYFGNLGNNPLTQVLFWGDPVSRVTEGILISENPASIQLPSEAVGPMVNFSFARLYLSAVGFSAVSKILTKPNPSKFEDRILSALQWAGRASVELRKEESFMLFAIALEGLVGNSDEKNEITEKLALRVAHLTISKSTVRQDAYKDLKKLYGVRSKIVHSGSVDVSDDQLRQIRFFVQQAILTVLTVAPFRTMVSDTDLMAWFQARTLGVETDLPSEPDSPGEAGVEK